MSQMFRTLNHDCTTFILSFLDSQSLLVSSHLQSCKLYVRPLLLRRVVLPEFLSAASIRYFCQLVLDCKLAHHIRSLDVALGSWPDDLDVTVLFLNVLDKRPLSRTSSLLPAAAPLVELTIIGTPSRRIIVLESAYSFAPVGASFRYDTSPQPSSNHIPPEVRSIALPGSPGSCFLALRKQFIRWTSNSDHDPTPQFEHLILLWF